MLHFCHFLRLCLPVLGCERLVAKWLHFSLENKADLIKKNDAISCSGMGLELDLLY